MELGFPSYKAFHMCDLNESLQRHRREIIKAIISLEARSCTHLLYKYYLFMSSASMNQVLLKIFILWMDSRNVVSFLKSYSWRMGGLELEFRSV